MKLKYQFAVRSVAGAIAAVAVGESSRFYHNVIALNETGADIFKLLQEGLSEEEIVGHMLEKYDVTEETLRPEVERLIQQLRDEELLID